MRGRVGAVVLGALLVAVSVPAVPMVDLAPGDGDVASRLAAGEAVPVRLDGTAYTVQAEPRSILGDGVQPRLFPGNETLPRPDPDSYVGEVAGMPEATVRLVVDGTVEGYVLLPGGGGWWVSSDGGGELAATPFAELPMPRGLDLSGDVEHAPTGSTGDGPAAPIETSPADVHRLDLALEADHRFYVTHSESWDEEMLEAFHLVEGIYRSQIGVEFNVSWIGAWEEDDPYDEWRLCEGTPHKLAQFRDYWEENRDHVPRHNAYLTAGGAHGSGCAYVKDVDTDYAYAVSYWRAGGLLSVAPEGFTYHRMILQAHELGHNFAGTHFRSIGGCGEGTIMAECYFATVPVFSPRRLDAGQGNLIPMRSYAHSRLPSRPLV